MKREEIGAAAVGFALGALIIGALVQATSWFAASDYSNAASNLLGIIAGPSLIAGLAVAAWRRWHCRCSVPRCVRLGEHPVDGCLGKVCDVHHTSDHHRIVFKLLGEAHRLSGRLARGQSVRPSAFAEKPR